MLQTLSLNISTHWCLSKPPLNGAVGGHSPLLAHTHMPRVVNRIVLPKGGPTQSLEPVVVIQLFSRVRLFVTPWTAAQQASLSFTISCSLLKLMSIELMMPANHLILCHPLLLPSIFSSIGVFSMSWLFTSGCQSIGASASASIPPMNIQG